MRKRIGGTLLAAAVLLVPSAVATPAQAHDTAHCYHGDISNGAWYTQYAGHHWHGDGRHWNHYNHYYYGGFVHSEENHCGG